MYLLLSVCWALANIFDSDPNFTAFTGKFYNQPSSQENSASVDSDASSSASASASSASDLASGSSKSSSSSSANQSSVASMNSSTTGSASSQQTPASIATQQSVLSSAVSSPVPSSTSSSSQQVASLAVPTSSSITSEIASQTNSSDNKNQAAGSSSVSDIRTALFGDSKATVKDKLGEETLYRYYQWVVMRQEASNLRKSLSDPFGTKSLNYGLDVMLGSLDPTQPVLGTYSLIYGDTMNRGLQVNPNPMILPMNLLVSQLLNAALFPVIQPTSDLSNYTYSQPAQNLASNKSNLSFHAQEISDVIVKSPNMLNLSQNYIYLAALAMQLKSCSANYVPAQSNSSSSGISTINSLTQALGSQTGSSVNYYLVPTGSDLSTYSSGLTGMTAVTCNANICVGGQGQGCPSVGSNYDAQGNGFVGILNLLSIISQNISVNPQSAVIASENAAMALLNNQKYTGSDLPDALQCMNSASIFGDKAIIKCQAANVAVIDLLYAYSAEKQKQIKNGGDLTSQGIISGRADGLGFVNKMSAKSAIVVKKLNDLMPIMATSAIYQAGYKYFLAQVIPSHSIAKMSAQDVNNLNSIFSSSPQTSAAFKDNTIFNDILNKTALIEPVPSYEQQISSRNASPISWQGSNFLFGEKASSNDLLISMSSASFVESLLNAVMSTPYVAGLPIPKNTVDNNGRLYQWVSLAGSFYLLSSDGVSGSWFLSKPLSSSRASKSYQIAVSSSSFGENMWNQRKNYLNALSKAISQQNNIIMHDSSVQSWALTQIKNYEYERSVQYSYKVNNSNDVQNYTPIQILTESSRWRLNPTYGWRNSLDLMDTNELLREMLYIMSENQVVMTRLMLDIEDMKLMQSVDFYNNGASGANNMGMGPLSDIQNNISSYVNGYSTGMSTSNMQDMQEQAQQNIANSIAAAQSVNPSQAVSSMLPSNISGTAAAQQATSSLSP